MRHNACAALLLILYAVPSAAQAPPASQPELFIYFRAYVTMIAGPEKSAGVTFGAPATVRETTTGAISMRGCGAFAASSGMNRALEGAEVGWQLEATPVAVVDQTVTFRLRWTRAVDRLNPRSGAPPGGDVELTLKLGESRELDGVALPGAAGCDKNRVAIRIGIEPTLAEQYERRLIAMDVWLVERGPDGKERTQQMPLRMLPNRSTSFYFDSIRAGTAWLDVYGHVLPTLDGSAVDLAIETITRWEAERPAYPYRWLRSTVRVVPNEVLDLTLPKLGQDGGPFADHALSLRIRARQVR